MKLRSALPLVAGILVATGLIVYVATGGNSYSFERTAACLDSSADTTGMTSDVDYLAQTVTHAEATEIDGNLATLLEAGSDVRREYVALGQAATDQHANLLVVWDDVPTAAQKEVVSSCLK